MDLSFSEEQTAIAGLALSIFEGQVTQDRVREVEAGPERFDRVLWAELGRAELLGVGIGAQFGGIGGGMLEVASLLEEFGRSAARIPLLWHCLAGTAIAAYGTASQQEEWLPRIASGDAVFTVALREPGSDDPSRPATTASGRGASLLEGSKTAVPYAPSASRVLTTAATPDGPRMFLLDPASVEVGLERQTGTSGEPQALVTLSGAPGEPIGDRDAVEVLRQHAFVALCAVQAGLAERALRLTAEHLKVREQFGRPIGTFQAVQQRVADAYIDVEAMRWTMWQAAWFLDEGLPAEEAVVVAKYWAAEGGHRVLAAAQHLHGGLGVDVDYPLHRYTTAAKQIEMTLGSAPRQLAVLGDLIAEAR